MTTSTRRDHHQRFCAERGLASAEWSALGTSVHVLVTAADRLEAARVAVEEVLGRTDRAASRFRADSELTRVNTARGAWVRVSSTLFQAMQVALDAAAWTDGLVDPTVGAALIDLGYDRTFARVPSADPRPVVRVRAVAGWRQVELDDRRMRVRVPAGTVVDLGATAKGLAADWAAEEAAMLAGCGVLVNLGGDLAVAGPPPLDGWVISVRDSASLDLPVDVGPEQTVTIATGAVATSSPRARRWRRGGAELHHLIDPRIGRPARGGFRSVSVAAATCRLANAASTAAIILGDGAPQWLRARGLAARLVADDGAVRCVAGWPSPEMGAS
jgi:thiamine biosynthesis lipoprotein